MKKALITGITGQDGSYLAELLLQKGYDVYGLIRRSSNFNTARIEHLINDPEINNFHLLFGDVTDISSMNNIIGTLLPDEVYNLAAQSHVRVSFDIPIYTIDSVAVATVGILEAIKNLSPKTKLYQASSSEMFGGAKAPQNEETPFLPKSPYGNAKVLAHNSSINYREGYNIFVANGILFNHESPRRGETFVTKKITSAVAKIKNGLQEKLVLGNLDAVRDWGYAPEYVEAMWKMLQIDRPDDFVVATGTSRTVKSFVKAAFEVVNLNWEEFVLFDDRYLRPTEVDVLIGDANKAKRELNWTPTIFGDKLVEIMVEHDLAQIHKH